MEKCKLQKLEEENIDINSLVGELETANDEMKKIELDHVTVNDTTESTNDKKEKDISDLDRMRLELIKLSENGEIDQSIKHIEKASSKVISKLYKEYEDKRMQKANEFLTDLFISKFSKLMGGLDAIDSVENMEDELKKDELLRRVNNLVASLTPYIPYLGLLSGSITVGKHVSKHMLNKAENTSNKIPVGDENVTKET